MNHATKNLAQWLGVYLEPGTLDADDLTPENLLNNEDGWGLDAEALEEIYSAFISILRDERAQKVHHLAHELAFEIKTRHAKAPNDPTPGSFPLAFLIQRGAIGPSHSHQRRGFVSMRPASLEFKNM